MNILLSKALRVSGPLVTALPPSTRLLPRLLRSRAFILPASLTNLRTPWLLKKRFHSSRRLSRGQPTSRIVRLHFLRLTPVHAACAAPVRCFRLSTLIKAHSHILVPTAPLQTCHSGETLPTLLPVAVWHTCSGDQLMWVCVSARVTSCLWLWIGSRSRFLVATCRASKTR